MDAYRRVAPPRRRYASDTPHDITIRSSTTRETRPPTGLRENFPHRQGEEEKDEEEEEETRTTSEWKNVTKGE